MNLDEFTEKFRILNQKGFIRSKRKSSTGIGYTFETELGLKENNLALPDID
ncbi:MAG: MvaI/BcnI family restriction endonuclease, partial [Microcystaceae cyanobacterium]